MATRRKQPAYFPLPTPRPELPGTWRDITSYSQTDPVPRVPRTWEMKVNGDFRITVTRHVGYPPEQWLMVCRPFWDLKELKCKDAEDAKDEALGLLREKLERTLRDLPLQT